MIPGMDRWPDHRGAMAMNTGGQGRFALRARRPRIWLILDAPTPDLSLYR